MQTFKINDELEIVCEWKKTRTAFKHEATLLRNGIEIDTTKICYQNRTWERFEFESIISRLLGKTKVLDEEESKKYLDKLAGVDRDEVEKKFGIIAEVAKMSDVFCKDKKSSNDWKARMIKAGLGESGFIMPEDWEDLTEEEKEVRLNCVIKSLSEKI